MWWFLTQLTLVTASSIEKVYYWWFHFLGKLAMCSKIEVMLKDSTTLSVNVPWALLTPFLRIGAGHRAFFSSLDLWRLVQETILYFQLAMSCIFQISDYKISGLWNLLPSQLYAIDIKESSRNQEVVLLVQKYQDQVCKALGNIFRNIFRKDI